jgi:hypothetical protein
MKVSDYAKLQGVTRAGVYYQIHHGLVPYYTKCGHYHIDETEIDVEAMDRKVDTITLEALIKIFWEADKAIYGNERSCLEEE